MTQCCGLTTVAFFLATLFDKKENTMRQQLREWYWPDTHKKGHQRQTLDVTVCFAALLQWILKLWPDDERRIALAMDATNLSDRFTLLVVSVVYRGTAIPVAWTALAGSTKGAWKPYWIRLFKHLQGVTPDDWFVIVMADRGLYAGWLYHKIQSLGWRPFLRINVDGNFRVAGETDFCPLQLAIPPKGKVRIQRVTCFRNTSLDCTLLAWWDEPYEEVWLIVTDIFPETADIVWYGMRSWIEAGFKDIKRGGWQWQRTRMEDADRVERLWLVLAVATLWAVAVGSEAEDAAANQSISELPELHIANKTRKNNMHRQRTISCTKRGFILSLTSLILGRVVLPKKLAPGPWPQIMAEIEYG